MPSRVITIVFTDIKGFTERTASSGRDFALKLMARHDELLKPIIARYQGILIKTIGDAYLLRFDSPTDAVLCSMMMQAALREYNLTAPTDEKIEIRIAINTGEVNVMETDILGEPVNVAARLEGITEAGEIWFTEATYLSMNKQEVPTAMVGEFRLKGVPEALRVYRVVQDQESDSFRRALAGERERFATRAVVMEPASSRAEKAADSFPGPGSTVSARSYSRPWLFALLGAALILGGGIFLHQQRQKPFRALEQTAVEVRAMLEKRERDEARARLETLAKEFPDNPDIEYGVMKIYGETGFYYPGILDHLLQVLKLDENRFASDPAVLENLEYFLTKFRPDDGWPELRQILTRRFLGHFRPLLEKGLYTAEDEGRVLRYNALELLPQAGGTVDRFRFFLNELENAPSVNSEFERLLQAYLAERLKAGDPAEVQAVRTLLTKKLDTARAENSRWEVERWETFNASLTRLIESLGSR